MRLQFERHQLRNALWLPSPDVGRIYIELNAVAVGILKVQRFGHFVINWLSGNSRRIQLRFRFAQLVDGGTDVERNVVQPYCGLAAAASLTAHFHYREVVVIPEGKEGHLKASLIQTRAEWQPEQVTSPAL